MKEVIQQEEPRQHADDGHAIVDVDRSQKIALLTFELELTCQTGGLHPE
jgi:hypothetical protein